jgi:deoxyribodipyrimidine photo-lyase
MQTRVRQLNQQVVRGGAKYVLYWAQMNRRVDSNHGLEFAAQMANDLSLPLLYYEGLTCSYPHASDRFHTFVLEGVPEQARRLAERGIGYCFYLRRKHSDPNDVLYRLAEQAAAVVSDDYPVFLTAKHNPSVAEKLEVPYHVVDSSCVVPMNLIRKREYAAYTIRPKIMRLLPQYLHPVMPIPLRKKMSSLGAAEAFHTPVRAEEIPALVASCEIDHAVPPSLGFTGGRTEAEKRLTLFLDRKLKRYAEDRNEPSAHATSDLSPYLHFGMISSLEVALAARRRAEELGISAEEFLEELIVRRELAFNFARHSPRPDSLSNLPEWATETLRKHATDKRKPVYTRQQFCDAQTHDALWNATQREMLLRGKIHGYYRMYWGKKIIEWSPTCQDALETMVYIHDRWALDGRDPNTYTNILWCFGLHDRPWQERPVFGLIRYMSLDGMKRKTRTEAYIREIRHLEETGKDLFSAA